MIKKLKKLIRETLLKFNINIYLLSNSEQINLFLKFFKIEIPENVDLVRIGSRNDGGYLVPNILSEIEFCYSAGIGNNIDFEKDLIKNKIYSFGADGSIENIPKEIENYNFLKKNIGIINNENNIRFEDWINKNTPESKSLIGQIDIEGGEYNLIIDTPIVIFKKFKILIIEFHNLSKINNKIIYDNYFSCFEKLLKIFKICHIHINNAEKPIKVRGIEIPPLLEITFLNKDFYTNNNRNFEIPNKLDNKNVEIKKDVKFDKNWIKNIKNL